MLLVIGVHELGGITKVPVGRSQRAFPVQITDGSLSSFFPEKKTKGIIKEKKMKSFI